MKASDGAYTQNDAIKDLKIIYSVDIMALVKWQEDIPLPKELQRIVVGYAVPDREYWKRKMDVCNKVVFMIDMYNCTIEGIALGDRAGPYRFVRMCKRLDPNKVANEMRVNLIYNEGLGGPLHERVKKRFEAALDKFGIYITEEESARAALQMQRDELNREIERATKDTRNRLR